MKLALLGTWHLHAAHHVDAAARNPSSEVVAVWDSRPGKAESFGAEHSIPVATDLQSLLARDDLDGVIIDTATTEHFAVIKAALSAKKHVFSEKVLSTSSHEAQALTQLANEQEVLLEVSFPMLAAAPVRTILRLVLEGELGTVTGSRVRWAHHGAVGIPWIPEHFFNLSETGGGALIDLGAHPIYLSMLFHGADPESVYCTTSHMSGREVEDNAVAVMSFPGGAIAVAEMSMVASYFGFSIEVIGEAGSVTLGPTGTSLKFKAGSEDWREIALDEALPDGFDQWVDRVISGHRDGWLEHVAVEVSRTIEAGYESARSGHVRRLDNQ